jgi:TAG lipase/steryl ester hydrolase/phospholipase A2/LPA acyltransferase
LADNFLMIALDVVAFFYVRMYRTAQGLWDRLLCFFTRGKRLRQRRLRQELHRANGYEEWRATAARLDALEGNDKWRALYESTCYDFEVVKNMLRELKELRGMEEAAGRGGNSRADLEELLYTLRGMLSRSFAGLNSKELFGSSHLGTKHLVEEFQDELSNTLRWISEEVPAAMLSADAKAEFFHHARHSFGRTALCLSGGGALTMYHMGVVRSLIQARVMPRIVSGTSGGSIVAAMLARYTDDEMLESILVPDISNRYGVRWFDPFVEQLHNYLKLGHLADTEKFAATCRKYYGETTTFGEAFAHTRRVVSICVTCRGASSGSHPRLLNYLTSPNVLLWSAVHASCALPGLFPSVELMARNPKTGAVRPFLPGQAVADGSINADLPMQRLAELFNVNNFIVSQVNPHVNPFISNSDVSPKSGRNSPQSLTKHIEYLLNLDVQNRCRKLAKIGLFPRVFGANVSGVFVQRYVGNVTIAPRLTVFDNFRAIQHPSQADMERYLIVGSRACFPKLDVINHMTKVEKMLRKCSEKWNRKAASKTMNLSPPAQGRPTSSSVLLEGHGGGSSTIVHEGSGVSSRRKSNLASPRPDYHHRSQRPSSPTSGLASSNSPMTGAHEVKEEASSNNGQTTAGGWRLVHRQTTSRQPASIVDNKTL